MPYLLRGALGIALLVSIVAVLFGVPYSGLSLRCSLIIVAMIISVSVAWRSWQKVSKTVISRRIPILVQFPILFQFPITRKLIIIISDNFVEFLIFF